MAAPKKATEPKRTRKKPEPAPDGASLALLERIATATESLQAELSAEREEARARHESVASELSQLTRMLDEIDRRLVERTEGLDQRLEALGFELNERFREVQVRLETVDAQVKKAVGEASQIRTSLLENRDEVRALRAKTEYIRNRVDQSSQAAIADLERRMQSLENR